VTQPDILETIILVQRNPIRYISYLRTIICSHGLVKHKSIKYDYSLQLARQQGNSKRRLHKEILVEVNFSLVLLLALCTVEDFHIKLRCANVEVEGHEETSLDVMIIHKLRPAALEVLFARTVVPDFHLIWSSSPRVFMKNCFTQLSPIHELGEL
jgi:hypothetical protein